MTYVLLERVKKISMQASVSMLTPIFFFYNEFTEILIFEIFNYIERQFFQIFL